MITEEYSSHSWVCPCFKVLSFHQLWWLLTLLHTVTILIQVILWNWPDKKSPTHLPKLRSFSEDCNANTISSNERLHVLQYARTNAAISIHFPFPLSSHCLLFLNSRSWYWSFLVHWARDPTCGAIWQTKSSCRKCPEVWRQASASLFPYRRKQWISARWMKLHKYNGDKKKI